MKDAKTFYANKNTNSNSNKNVKQRSWKMKKKQPTKKLSGSIRSVVDLRTGLAAPERDDRGRFISRRAANNWLHWLGTKCNFRVATGVLYWNHRPSFPDYWENGYRP